MDPRVILVRHAHAEWPQYQGRDFDRPLTPKGGQDARAAGRALQEAGHRPYCLLVSPAVRTRQTAQLLIAELGVPESAILLVDALYNAPVQILEIALRETCAACDGLVMMVAHNPGISDLAAQLSGDERSAPFAPADWRVAQLD